MQAGTPILDRSVKIGFDLYRLGVFFYMRQKKRR